MWRGGDAGFDSRDLGRAAWVLRAMAEFERITFGWLGLAELACDSIEHMFETEVAAHGLRLAHQLASVCLAEVDEDGVVDLLSVAEQLTRWATAAQLATTSELARRRDDLQFVEDEIAAELRLSRVAAGARLSLALDLERLPAVAAALALGQLDLPKARAIADAVAVLRPGTAERVTAEAVGRAGRQTVGELRAWLRRKVLRADPDAARERHAQARADRRVTLTAVGDGMAELWALLPADEAARVYATIEAYARAAATGPCAGQHSADTEPPADGQRSAAEGRPGRSGRPHSPAGEPRAAASNTCTTAGGSRTAAAASGTDATTSPRATAGSRTATGSRAAASPCTATGSRATAGSCAAGDPCAASGAHTAGGTTPGGHGDDADRGLCAAAGEPGAAHHPPNTDDLDDEDLIPEDLIPEDLVAADRAAEDLEAEG